ncbi:hypothetical protein CCHR01_11644 [Colletotrichum chrysophilum]|uniref:Uncharacterized protein n=1 Tax=Colletotrichum chrysophilum TaxID=1836956 RepID=A0AAD9AHL4_9PEZI|nr:hypothetical protein CCHR01_11644 [Colletotrichum chrysophilum]
MWSEGPHQIDPGSWVRRSFRAAFAQASLRPCVLPWRDDGFCHSPMAAAFTPFEGLTQGRNQSRNGGTFEPARRCASVSTASLLLNAIHSLRAIRAFISRPPHREVAAVQARPAADREERAEPLDRHGHGHCYPPCLLCWRELWMRPIQVNDCVAPKDHDAGRGTNFLQTTSLEGNMNRGCG